MSQDRQSFPYLSGVPHGPIYNALVLIWKRFNGPQPSAQLSGVITRETPTGTQDSANVRFFLRSTPVPGSESVYVNGLLQTDGNVNYRIQGTAITFVTPPAPTDVIRVSYRAA